MVGFFQFNLDQKPQCQPVIRIFGYVWENCTESLEIYGTRTNTATDSREYGNKWCL